MTCHNHCDSEPFANGVNKEPVIELSEVCFWRGPKEILHNVNLCVDRGDFIAITGPNGGGKTTLLRIILKLIKPDIGSVRYYKENNVVNRLSIGYLPQKNMIDSRFPLTVYDVIRSGLLSLEKLSKNESHERVVDMIHTVGLEAKSDSPIGELSGGQLQRALLGRAIIASPEVLVLDEPLSYVDKRFEHRIYDILKKTAETSTIILVSHEMSAIAAMANRHLIVDHTLRNCDSGSHLVHYDCES